MPKRPSLFASKPAAPASSGDEAVHELPPDTDTATSAPQTQRAPSRVGKRVLSIYLDPLAWRQLRDLALDLDTSTQALGEEAINLLFAKHHRNRSA
jgi:hypothetical protein